MKIAIIVATVLIPFSLLLGAPKTQEHIEQNEPIIEHIEQVEEVAVEEPAAYPIPEPIDIVKANPQGCIHATQWILPDGTCKDKTLNQRPATEPVRASQSVSQGSGSCHAEIAKYDWPQSIATAVMMAESGGNPAALNNNPATGDYSVGCFQVNLYGANARNRPSEAELKNAAVNVAWAYNNYKANGHSFIGQWGVCRKISCI